MRTHVSLDSMGALIEGTHENPFELLGPHPIEQDGRTALAVRAYLPESEQAWVLDPSHQVSRPMRRIHPAGLYEAICPVPQDPNNRYLFRVADSDGEVTTMHDPYSFESLLTDYDFFLFGQGRHERIYDKLGAQVRTIDGVTGTNFAVWAPNATASASSATSITGTAVVIPCGNTFPAVSGSCLFPRSRRARSTSFDSTSRRRQRRQDRSLRFRRRIATSHGSIVTDLTATPLERPAMDAGSRDERCAEQPISIYEVHLGSWRRSDDRLHGWLNYRELANQSGRLLSARWATRISSCCRSASIRLPEAGDIRRSVILR